MKLDTVYCQDARNMSAVEDGSVQLVVTSPPYNVDKPYEGYKDSRELREYLEFLKAVWKECHRVLCPGGRIAVNIANTYRQPYLPLHAEIIQDLRSLGFLMRGEIIWDKAASAGVSTAWGSFARASNPVLRDVHEYVMVFSKDSFKLEANRQATAAILPPGLSRMGPAGEPEPRPSSGISNQDFVDWTRSIWRMGTESRLVNPVTGKRYVHPAPFPVELPRRLILLYTNRDDLVLDPFMGSGSTAVASVREGRHFVGYDISPEYCGWTRERVEAELELRSARADVQAAAG